MPTEAHDVPLTSPSIGAPARAMWIGGGLLALATAGVAGALIMRAVQPTPSAPVATAAVASLPVPTASAPAPAPVLAPAPAAAPVPAKPVHHAQPAKRPDTTTAQAGWSAPGGTTHAAICTSCGVVESVESVRQKGEATGLGAVAGGVLGGVVGHQVGGGNGKTAMTVLGAIGGGLAGNEVEKRARGETLFNVQVRMEDGSMRTFQRAQSLAVGTHVVVEGTTLRTARDTGNGAAPQMQRTAAPAGNT